MDSMSSMSGMDMTSTMSMSPSSTMSGMNMPSSTDSSMSMSSDGSMMMGMDSMAMVFFTSQHTPLYSMSWTPTTTGQYVGTCMFLITFAAVFRALIAVRLNFYDILAMRNRHRQGLDVSLRYVKEKERTTNVRPWRASEAVSAACLDVLLAGFSYLLMIAVMTMNVGYFISILAGVFVGSMIFGRFMAGSAAH